MKQQFFIAGTDTSVGKTVASAVLTLALNAFYWKPIQTGIEDDPYEQDTVKALTGFPETRFIPSHYAFKAGLAIDQAANLESQSVELDRFELPHVTDALVVEGAGGVFHPLNEFSLFFDLMKKLNLPVIIVCRGTLGTINHSLLTIDALQHRGIPIHGIIFSGDVNRASQASIEKWGNVRTLFSIPPFSSLTSDVLKKWVSENQAAILEGFSR